MSIFNLLYRYVSDSQQSFSLGATPHGSIGPQLPSEYPSLIPHIPVNYQAIPTFNITWHQNQQSHVSFPEDENSVVSYEPEAYHTDFANNEIANVNYENTNTLVDGFWINDGTCLCTVKRSFGLVLESNQGYFINVYIVELITLSLPDP